MTIVEVGRNRWLPLVRLLFNQRLLYYLFMKTDFKIYQTDSKHFFKEKTELGKMYRLFQSIPILRCF